MKTVAFELVRTETLLLRSTRAGYWAARITCEPEQHRRLLDQALERVGSCDEAKRSTFVVSSRVA
jgi:hypothetical protein